MAQNWLNADSLFLQYGTDKTVPEVAGEFLSYGANRIVEVLIDLTKLTSTAAIQSNTTFFPFGGATGESIYIEKIRYRWSYTPKPRSRKSTIRNS